MSYVGFCRRAITSYTGYGSAVMIAVRPRCD